MAHPPRYLPILKDAIDVVLRRLSALPPSSEVETLRANAASYLRLTDIWIVSPPGADGREKLMKAVLMLHVNVEKLEREKAGA